MNRILKTNLVFALVVLGLATSCKPDEPYMTVTPNTVSFTQEGGTQTLSLSTNSMSWSASISGSGFTVSPTSGAGDTQLTLTARAATSSEDATATLTIKSGTLLATVAITQGAKNTLTATGANSVEAEGGTYTISLKYNTDYTVEIEESAKSWIQYVATRAMQSASLDFQIAANTGSARTGNITIKDNANIATPQVITINQKENALRTQLMSLYTALDGDNWTEAKKANWNTDKPIDTWGGVTVEDNKITKLNFSGFGLNGTLPVTIGSFTDLTSLNLGSNPNLTGALPEELGNLVNMEGFLAVTTGLSGSLPASMGQWTKLTNLQLNKNNISGTIPEEWAGMTALKSFGMFSTQISSPLPDAIFTSWKHIGSILLYDNPNLTGSLPAAIGNITTDNTLLSIHLYECNFTGGIPSEWGNIPDVSKQLRVYGNKLTEPVPLAILNHPCWTTDRWDSYKTNSDIHYIRTQQDGVFLELEVVPNAQRDVLMALYNALDGDNWTAAKKTNWNTDEPISTWGGVTVENDAITKLNFSGFNLNGTLPDAIGAFPLLISLNLGSNAKLTGPLPAAIGNLTNLETFTAVTTGLQGPLPKEMGNLTKLTNLQLNNNKITGTIPKEWAGMESLKSFGMFNTLIESPLPDEIFTSWKHVGSILLNSNPNLKGALPEALGRMTTDNTLFSVHLYDCNFTGGIPQSWGELPAVSKQLRVYGNKLTEPVPACIIQHPGWKKGWNAYKTNTEIHYIRSQQNDVFLDLEAVLPTVSDVTVSDVTYQAMSLAASVTDDGGATVTDRGFIVGTTQRRVGSGTGDFSSSFTSLNSNTAYTVKAYATNSAGTAYSAEQTITTKTYAALSVALYDTAGLELASIPVFLERIGDLEQAPASAATKAPTAIRPKAIQSGRLAEASTEKELLEGLANQLLKTVRPYRQELLRNYAQLESTWSRTAFTKSAPRAAGAVATEEMQLHTSPYGIVEVDGLETGMYALRVQSGRALQFYTTFAVNEGDNSYEYTNVPTLDANSNLLQLFQNNTAVRPFVSESTVDNVISLVEFAPDMVSPYVGRKFENLVFFPTDTISGMAIIAPSAAALKETYEVLLQLGDSSGVIDPNTVSQEVLVELLKTHAQRLIPVTGVTPNRTQWINQPASNMKTIMFNQLTQSQKDMLKLMDITENPYLNISSGDGISINFVTAQQSNKGTFLTDGQGPAQPGGNGLSLGSQINTVSSLSDVGYAGNWHISATVR